MIEQPRNTQKTGNRDGTLGSLPDLQHQFGVEQSCMLTASGAPRECFAKLLDSYGIRSSQPADKILSDMKANWWGEGTGLLLAVREAHLAVPDQQKEKLLQELGHISPVNVEKQTSFSHALLMGGPLPWVRDRLHNLVNQWEQGVRFETLVVLGADRPLEARHGDTLKNLKTQSPDSLKFKQGWEFDPETPYHDEMDMMRAVFEQSVLPQEWGGSVPVEWIKSIGKDGRHPNTEQTVVDFLVKTNDQKFECILSASSQPFVHYQNLVTAAAFAEASVEATDFLGTGAGQYSGTPDICPEFAYLDQMIRRLQYEIRFRYAREMPTNQLDAAFTHKRPQPPKSA